MSRVIVEKGFGRRYADEGVGGRKVVLRPVAPSSQEEWYHLDNAATLFPGVASARITTLFRIGATLQRPVNASVLQKALANIVPRFPYYLVHLKAGVFWYYLVRREMTPRVIADSRWPCMSIPTRMRGTYLFRVRAFGRKVSVEFSHIITDGTGALTFLRALLVEYFTLIGVEISDSCDIFRKETIPDGEEYEDAYSRYFSKSVPSPSPKRHAFRLPYPLLPVGVYRTITGIVPVAELAGQARERGVTVTVFLAAVLAQAFYDLYLDLPSPAKRFRGKFIRIEVPVNLRRLYATKSMRNFSLFVMPSIDVRLGPYSLEETIKLFHHFMKVEVDGRFINQQIARNIRGQRNPFVRIVPLIIKNLLFPYLYFSKGEALVSSVLTNLGVATMPSEVSRMIERFEFVPAPSRWNKTGCAVISYGTHSFITFGRMTGSTEVERRFFSTLVKLGIPVKIETN